MKLPYQGWREAPVVKLLGNTQIISNWQKEHQQNSSHDRFQPCTNATKETWYMCCVCGATDIIMVGPNWCVKRLGGGWYRGESSVFSTSTGWTKDPNEAKQWITHLTPPVSAESFLSDFYYTRSYGKDVTWYFVCEDCAADTDMSIPLSDLYLDHFCTFCLKSFELNIPAVAIGLYYTIE